MKTIKMNTPVGLWVWAGVAVLLLVVIVFFSDPIFKSNFAEVIPGEVYKSAQMTDRQLRETIEEYGIKVVINLRGEKDEAWYEQEKRLCAEEGVTLVDIGMSGSKRPKREELQRLVQALVEHDDVPVHIHCRQGVDRASLAGAFAVVIKHKDGEKARDVFALKNLATGTGFNGRMQAVLEEYLGWVERNGKSLGRESLVEWVDNFYTGRSG